MTQPTMNLPNTSPLGPTIETQRLILRPPVSDDFAGYCEFYADEIAMKHLGGIVAPSMVWRTLRSVVGQWALDGFGAFSVIEKASNQWIGRIGPQYPLGWPDREVGWGIITKHCGKGYAREAAKASIDYAFEVLKWQRVVHVIAPANSESQVLAQRLGSNILFQAELPPPVVEMVDVWGQTREDWLRARQA